jgi:hypothetical protein
VRNLYNLGFEIEEGAKSARFSRGGETVLELDRSDQFFTFDIDDDSSYDSCDECDDSVFSVVNGDSTCESGSDVFYEARNLDLHSQVLLCVSELGPSEWVLKASVELKQHYLDGHRTPCIAVSLARGASNRNYARIPRFVSTMLIVVVRMVCGYPLILVVRTQTGNAQTTEVSAKFKSAVLVRCVSALCQCAVATETLRGERI